MNPVASPRHPFKALAVVLATFALVHGACAHVFTHDHDSSRIHAHHAAQVDEDEDDDGPDVDVHVGPDVDARFGPNFPFDDDTPAPKADPFDHDFD